MRVSGRRKGGLLALIVVGLLAAGCGDDDSTETAEPSDDDSTSTTVKPSGSITVYSGRNEALIKPILDQFTTDTGVTVNLRAGDSGALGAQLLTEGKASPADVFISQDAGALGAVSRAGLLDKLSTSLVARVPSAYAAKDRTWVGVSGRVRVVVYNPNLVPTPPTQIDEVLDAKWKGKVGFAPSNASWQSFVTALRVVRGEAAAKTWLERFKANDPKPYSANGAVRDAVNSGEIALGLINHYYVYEKIAAVGAANVIAKNAFLAAGDIGGLVNVAGAGVLGSSKNKPAAVALIDYLLSEKAQRYFAEKTFEYPLISTVTPSVAIPKLDTLKPPSIDLSDLASLEKTQDLLASVGLLTK